MALLQVENLTKKFGGLIACNQVSFQIEEGEILGLIGPNGAGKTTLFNCIVGFYKPEDGKVVFKGEDITGLNPSKAAHKGIGRSFQVMRIMNNLSVLENVMIGAFCRTNDREEARSEARDVLDILDLKEVGASYPSELPIATQKRIELARALATKPRLLMLDEVASGLTPAETENIISVLDSIHNRQSITFLVIEHVMEFVLEISDRVMVLDNGKKIAEGLPQEVTDQEKVIKAYLGEKYANSK